MKSKKSLLLSKSSLTKSLFQLINEKINYELLEICFNSNGNKNISDIQELLKEKKMKLTYKALLERLKKLKGAGMIYFETNNKGNFPRMDKSSQLIYLGLQHHKKSDLHKLSESLKDKQKTDLFYEILLEVSNKRFITRNEIIDKFYQQESGDINFLFEFINLIIESGYIKDRLELTREGKRLIQEISNDKTLPYNSSKE